MFTCKQVSKALASDDYENLSPLKKFMLKLHVKFCTVCGKFNQQVMDSHEMCQHYKKQEQDMESTRPKLDDNKKAQIKMLLKAQDTSQSKT